MSGFALCDQPLRMSAAPLRRRKHEIWIGVVLGDDTSIRFTAHLRLS